MKTDYKIDQGSKAWHEFRQKGIGASEVPAILGECDFKTALQVWELKTGRREPDKQNWAMKRGIDAERKIRALYELRTGNCAKPVLGEHSEYPFMRASFDGLDVDKSRVVEIKYPSKVKHEMALKGEIPKTYQAQIQHQLFVSGAKVADYVSYDGKDIAIVEVQPDYAFMKRILEACTKFWKCVENDTPPEASDKDYEKVKDKEILELADTYAKIKKVIDDNKADLEVVKKEIFSRIKHPRFKAGPVRGIVKFRKGNVNYKKIPELKDVDLDKYRGKDVEVKELKVL